MTGGTENKCCRVYFSEMYDVNEVPERPVIQIVDALLRDTFLGLFKKVPHRVR